MKDLHKNIRKKKKTYLFRFIHVLDVSTSIKISN